MDIKNYRTILFIIDCQYCIADDIILTYYGNYRNLNIHYSYILAVMVITAKWNLFDDLICEIMPCYNK